MTTTRTPGSDPARDPASLGGPGWRPRRASHADEIAAGDVWRRCGVASEHGALRSVLLALPGDELRRVGDPDEWLFFEPVDPDLLREQAEGVAALYRSRGVDVHVHATVALPPPNWIFLRDLFFMTPEGAIVARMASEQRAGEERFAARALASAGIPILHTVRGSATFEGADALWLEPRRVLVGVGFRTSREGFEQVRGVLGAMGVAVDPVPLPAGVQHLLGAVNIIDRDLAAGLEDKLSPEIRAALRRSGVEVLPLPSDAETVGRRGINFVALGPRRVALPAGCPRTREVLESRGVACEEVEVGEYVKAGGALGCLTGILEREASG